MNVVHVTHEAVEQMGGIGSVISGLVTSESYQEKVSRTVLLGPLMSTEQPVNRRLGEGGHVLYSSLDAIEPAPWREKFRPIESTYDVGIIYGTRKIVDACTGKLAEVEVVVVDVFHANQQRLNLFKAELWKKFAVPSHESEKIWEYEQYVRLAEPGFEALKAIDAADGDLVVILAHEYMGMPTALRAVLNGAPNTRTVFYAHEVASVRQIVEKHPGHDTMFYNLLCSASRSGATLERLFPSVFENFKHPLVKAARYCDHIFAVGDRIEDELRFVDSHFRDMEIDLVFNGIPSDKTTPAQRNRSRELLLTYAGNLLGERPSWIFTHVCRPVLSKGLWRDLGVLHEMDAALTARGEKAVYFLLCTMGGQRRAQDVLQMERVYGWPVSHEAGYPDLCGGEEQLGEMFDRFNARHGAVRAVLVNQWGWSRRVCGARMPEEMTFTDLRRGADVEFGMSVYEPYGISQFEPLCHGALCVVSNVCGCMGFARRVGAQAPLDDNIIEGDFLGVPEGMTLDALMEMSISERDAVEAVEARRLAGIIVDKLARDEDTLARRIRSGYELASRMNWDHVVDEYFLPALSHAAAE